MDKLYNTIHELGIDDVYSYVMENNNAYNNPYHNNFHLEHVCLFTIEGCEYYEVLDPHKKLVLTAALFHDFNHSGGRNKNDDDNIKLAIDGFNQFNSKFEMFSEEECNVITNLIKSTRYPYVSECSSLFEKILRDSDILQGPFCQNYINGIVNGLAKEIGIPLLSMLKGQVDFLKNSKFCTEWATKKFESILPSVLKKVEIAKSILEKK